jgi:hypothetical protein
VHKKAGEIAATKVVAKAQLDDSCSKKSSMLKSLCICKANTYLLHRGEKK